MQYATITNNTSLKIALQFGFTILCTLQLITSLFISLTATHLADTTYTLGHHSHTRILYDSHKISTRRGKFPSRKIGEKCSSR